MWGGGNDNERVLKGNKASETLPGFPTYGYEGTTQILSFGLGSEIIALKSANLRTLGPKPSPRQT